MILVDTCVLVDYLRAPSPGVRALLIERESAICGVVRAAVIVRRQNTSRPGNNHGGA
jgi:predicted nucleic acid-binding protein